MVQVTYTCKGCSATFVEDEPFSIEGVDDPDHPESFDSTQPPVHLETVCSSCCRCVEERFSRPTRATGRRSLGDELAACYRILMRALGKDKTLDPEVAKIFPNLSDSLARPRRLRFLRSQADLVDPLIRIGRDVCIAYRLEGVEVGETDQVILLTGLGKGGALAFCECDSAGAFDLPLMAEWVNGHDYDPDGHPLAID